MGKKLLAENAENSTGGAITEVRNADDKREAKKAKKEKKLKAEKKRKQEELSSEAPEGAASAPAKGEKKSKKKQRADGVSSPGASPDSSTDRVSSPPAASPAAPPAPVHAKLESWADVDVRVEGLEIDGDSSSAACQPLRPLTTFAEAAPQVPADLLSACASFASPSPIQRWAWPVLLRGRDLVAVAATGSGKTLAFGVPGLKHVLEVRKAGGGGKGKQRGSAHPSMLVVAPTRELAQQIAEVLEAAGKRCGVGVVCVFGGASKGGQRAALAQSPGVVVATPGRLKDHMQDGTISLAAASFVVLDEADRMLDMGFELFGKEVIFIVLDEADRMFDMGFEPDMESRDPDHRQTAMLSATWPPEISKLASDFLRNPVKVMVGRSTGGMSANDDVTQIVEVVEPWQKNKLLVSLLEKYHKSRSNRVLVFVLYKVEAARINPFSFPFPPIICPPSTTHPPSLSLPSQQSRARVCALQGGGRTDRSVTFFSILPPSSSLYSRSPLLPASLSPSQQPRARVATDVAARGLDIPNVEVVINCTFPLTTEDYVHRIGRTGRAGNKGIAHTLFTSEDKARAGELVNVLRQANQPVPEGLFKFDLSVKKKESKLYGAHFKDISQVTKKATKITFDSDDDE
ncbi:unnamed protein product [Closterium sp. NIES-65]|nr:unnamed protein product [Closterium sp. NIES-65]